MPAVKTCPTDPAALLDECRALTARQGGWREEVWGEIDGLPLPAFTRRASGGTPRPRIYLSAGIHGDEPAPPRVLRHLLETDFFDDRATWFVLPVINPTGLRLGQRENAAGADLNRDYLCRKTAEVQAHVAWLQRQPRFDLGLCLHEDWETTGFYLYELARDTNSPEPVRELRAAAAEHLPIEEGDEIDGRPTAEAGIIRPESNPDLRDQWPEAIYLFAHHTDRCYTFESPSTADMNARIVAQAAAVQTAVTEFVR